jgi:ABC-type multidrug transport system fused ATPase/permease subunit
MSVLRMIKLFGWEGRVKEDLAAKRRTELRAVFKWKMFTVGTTCLTYVIPLIHMIVTYGFFTLVQKQELSASIIFSSITGFNIVRQQVYMVIHFLPDLIQAKVSLRRLQDFLVETELLDEFTAQQSGATLVDASGPHGSEIGISAASFSWSIDESFINSTPVRPSNAQARASKGYFRLHVEDELVFHKGEINLIVGPTGSGKTSILMALLGEMHYIPSSLTSWVNLPRVGGVAYASQESWVQNETIRVRSTDFRVVAGLVT